jgi:hypothetical protein
MRSLRKKYRAEALLKEKEQKLQRAEEEQKRKERVLAMKEDIRKFKEERKKSIEDFGAAEEGTAVDEALDAQQTQQQQQQQQQKQPQTGTKAWASYISQRRQIRLASHLQHQATSSKRRLDSLMYLFHSSESFVTYSNLDKKLDEAFGAVSNKMSTTLSVETYGSLLAKAQTKIDASPTKMPTTVLATGKSASGKILSPFDFIPPSTSEHVDLSWTPPQSSSSGYSGAGAMSANDPAKARQIALKDALYGTLAGRPGVEAIQERMAYVESRGGQEAMEMERKEELEAYRAEREKLLNEKKDGEENGDKEKVDMLEGFLSKQRKVSSGGEKAE